MFNNSLSLLDKAIIKVVSSIKNHNDMEEIHETVKLLAVAIFFDKTVTTKEFSEAQHIISESFEKDFDFIALLLKEKLERYKNEFWVFKKDSEYILRKILVDGNWKYAEIMVEIFKSDGISKDENETHLKLVNLIENRKILLKELGLE